ncbi:MAG: CPBP family intramembrane metalloprotease [Lachnospiraceae bacterium]|nr:CPBP family intramembrane metalloprotease [Lachnospiraceae bacterium]
MNRKRDICLMILGYVGALAGCFGVIMFNSYVLTSLPLAGRMICMLIVYWLIALVPLVLIFVSKDKIDTLTFSREKIGMQILIGVAGGSVIASAYFLVPYFMGFGSYVDNGSRFTQLWQFAFELVYFIVAVGAVEEIVFRGFVYSKLKSVFSNEWISIFASSILFGLFHLMIGNIVQVCLTTIIGIIFCLVRYKVKGCTMLSLIILHGVYDFLIVLYSSLLFRV